MSMIGSTAVILAGAAAAQHGRIHSPWLVLLVLAIVIVLIVILLLRRK
jgi:uncharacterized membrane protein YkvI